jgi:hypothetical protein
MYKGTCADRGKNHVGFNFEPFAHPLK